MFSKSRGEIATTLTLISLGLMIAGAIAGTLINRQTNVNLPSKAAYTCTPQNVPAPGTNFGSPCNCTTRGAGCIECGADGVEAQCRSNNSPSVIGTWHATGQCCNAAPTSPPQPTSPPSNLCSNDPLTSPACRPDKTAGQVYSGFRCEFTNTISNIDGRRLCAAIPLAPPEPQQPPGCWADRTTCASSSNCGSDQNCIADPYTCSSQYPFRCVNPPAPPAPPGCWQDRPTCELPSNCGSAQNCIADPATCSTQFPYRCQTAPAQPPIPQPPPDACNHIPNASTQCVSSKLLGCWVKLGRIIQASCPSADIPYCCEYKFGKPDVPVQPHSYTNPDWLDMFARFAADQLTALEASIFMFQAERVPTLQKVICEVPCESPPTSVI